jgi:transposase
MASNGKSATESSIQSCVGLDVGDRYSQLCVIDAAAEVIEEIRISTTHVALERRFAGRPRARIVLESGTHSPWMSRALASWGHEVIVANARRVQLIAKGNTKSDRVDAELLARLGRADPRLLAPVQHRGAEAQADLAFVRSRDALVRARSLLVNHVRGTVKAQGERLPSCSTESFADQAAAALPPALKVLLTPVLTMVSALTEQIKQYDREVVRLATKRYPETKPLRQIAGVAELTALCYVLTLEDPARFATSRAVGSYLGLRPRKRASSDSDPECHITKAGDVLLRRLLVGSAHYILGPFGPDTDLRRWGLRLAGRGKKAAKKRAVIAVARKLGVLLHHLWQTQEDYVPLRRTRKAASTPAAA